jgi:hypothetical protein
MEVDTGVVDERKEGSAGALLAADERATGSLADSPMRSEHGQ